LFSKFVELSDEYNTQTIKAFHIPIGIRTQKAIVDRFARIKKVTSQFSGVVARNKIKSGEDIETHLARCVEVFEHTHKTKFVWMECYQTLEQMPKWNAQADASTQASSTAAAAPGQGKKKHHQYRARSQGKKHKTMDDNVARNLQKHNAQINPTGIQLTATTTGSLTQISNHMVEQLNFAHWPDEDKQRYFAQDAQEKALQQKKRIIMLQQELAELQACKDPKLDNGEDGGRDGDYADF
jgi:hypothetical protein